MFKYVFSDIVSVITEVFCPIKRCPKINLHKNFYLKGSTATPLINKWFPAIVKRVGGTVLYGPH